jgi:hypothetical protein
VSGSRLSPRVLPITATVAAAVYALWLRPRMLAWGATHDEVGRRYPGDELIPQPDHCATMATTLPAPPERVWPWLVQMGGDRGGWYTWDRLDNNGKPSADRIMAQYQTLETGQRLTRASAPGQPPGWFTVVMVEPNRTLVLRSSYGLFSGRQFDPLTDPTPWAWVDGVWSFHLQRTTDGQTRLVVRNPGRSGPTAVARLFTLLIGEPTHFAMQTRQFHNLRMREDLSLPDTPVFGCRIDP